MTDERDHPGVDGPTAMEPATGRFGGSPDDPTPEPGQPFDTEALATYGPTTLKPIGPFASTTPAPPLAGVDGPTMYGSDSGHELPNDDEPTAAVGTDEPTTTGPTVGGWPFDEFEPPPPDELVWRAEAPPLPPVAAHRPAYYVSLGAAVVIVVGLVALAAVVAVMRPQREIAGTAAGPVIPEISTPTQPTTTTQRGPLAEMAAHPLSSSTARMGDTLCALPRFDPADEQQAEFYAAAKVCADTAWRDVLREAGLDDVAVTVVTVTGPSAAGSCGELAPTSASTQCDGTVYLTPAHLRDTEQNGRFPGRYLGVFLREYASALQYTTGLEQLVAAVPNSSREEVEKRLAQQATCLAGVVAGAMSGRGAVDSNITSEIRARLSTVDAPPDAQTWLDKGFQQRTPAACNVWI
ncbi:hypothetical protein [Actinophytocola sp.]|uniref:hypothetical protein n=1 Tax=Actinophytocola sp. TaxID=1872138 RepID=UPI002ED26433